MGRLIDANANREKFKEIVYRTLNDCNITTKKKFNIIMTAFDNMPTAYDVEKVVEQLEDKLLSSSDAHAEAIVGMCGASANMYYGEKSAYTKAIEIVKRGGVE